MEQGYRHRGTGAVMIASGDGPPQEGWEPISLHDATVENARAVAALRDEGEQHSRMMAEATEADRQAKIELARTTAGKLNLSNADAAILFDVPEIADLPGKVVDEVQPLNVEAAE